MAERLRPNTEREAPKKDLERQAAERREQLQEQLERRSEQANEHESSSEKQLEKEAKNAAVEQEKTKEKHTSPAEKRNEKLVRNKKTLNKNFNDSMKLARRDMAAPSRAFSKVIHNPVVEKTSEALGSTVARPNAILFGSLFALVLTTGIYLWAKNAGYALSGFETIAAFIIGWLVGILFDFVRIMVTGKR